MTVQVLIYRPVQRYQLNKADPIGKFGCSNYSFAMYADAVTIGGLKISGADARKISSEPKPNPQSPGLNIDQLVEVADKLRIDLWDRTGLTWRHLIQFLKEDRRILLQLKNEELKDGTTTDVPHMILLQAIRSKGILGNNPLLKTAFWYNESNVKRAAEEFGRDTNVPGDGIRFAVSKPIPRIARTV